jgi:hypothetical protein
MADGKRVITRRDFMRAGSSLAMGTLMGMPLLGNTPVTRPGKSRVVLIREKKVLDGQGRPYPDILQNMLDQALMTLMDTPDPASAWSQLVSPTDVVAVKSNVWSYLPTPKSLEATIRNRLLETGVEEGNIVIDDRGFRRNLHLIERTTALINVRPMRTHHWSGLGTLIKNYIMFVPRPSKYHGNACENLGSIWRLPHVAGKTRLNILVMLTPLFHGIGPHHFSRRYTWPYGGLILSRDPVAADASGARIIQAKRDAFFGTQRPIRPPPRHIAAADTRFGLGNSRPERIRLIKMGWDKGALI